MQTTPTRPHPPQGHPYCLTTPTTGRCSLEQGSQDRYTEALSADDAIMQELEAALLTEQVDEVHQTTLQGKWTSMMS